MPYIGKSPLHGNYQKLDSISSSFDGSTTQFALTTNSVAVTPVTPAALLISINGVLQEPTTTFTVSGTNITFTSAPASTDTFFGVVLGEQLAIGTPSDSTITSAKLSGNLVTPGTLDVNGQELILDADADTTITADTDDQIDIKIAGADDFQFTANTFTVLSGSTLTIASGATIANSGTATGFSSADPSSADGDSLGTASAEWSDLYLADGGIIYFGNDQDVTVTHDPDDGLFLKSIATADNNPFLLTLQTGETDIAADDVIGKIAFQAPDEGTGTDAILVSAAIQAVAEGDHSSSSNATSLEFMTGASEAATAKMYVKSDGDVGIGTSSPAGVLHSFTSSNDGLLVHEATGGNAMVQIRGNRSTDTDIGHLKFYNNAGSADLVIFRAERQGANNSGLLKISTVDGGTNNTSLQIDKTGAVTLPLQPAVLAVSATVSNVSGNGDAYTTANFETEIFDQNADFNNSNFTFTAPVTGRYSASITTHIGGCASDNTRASARIVASNRDIIIYDVHGYNVSQPDPKFVLSGHTLIDMDANDTLSVTFYAYNGSKVVDWMANSSLSVNLVA
uniref:C1q domain-containing protein n=1 Tax=uncultured Bacteroidota bacterium TaxID=152509 RepID=A0A1B0Z1R3_9BACT|nr:hypothetical protein [uncultured Bacteroidetes bacterium]